VVCTQTRDETSRDFVPGAWPPELVERAAALEPQLGAAMRAFAERTFGRVTSEAKETMARLRLALLDASLGGIKSYVQAGEPAPQVVGESIAAQTRQPMANIQAILNDQGYDAGPVDGIMGGKTREAIIAFQRDNGLEATGNVDQALVEKLLTLANGEG